MAKPRLPMLKPRIATVRTERVPLLTGLRADGTASVRATRQRFYDKRAWRDRIRPAQLARQPICEECQAEGRIRPATQVDHRDGNPENNAPENLASLCTPHHSRKTNRHDGGFGQPIRRKE